MGKAILERVYIVVGERDARKRLSFGGRPSSARTIPPGTARYVDLLSISPRPQDLVDPVEGETQARVYLEAEPVRSDDRHVLAGGRWHVLIALTARDTDATYYSVVVDFDGLWWSAEQIRKHLIGDRLGEQSGLPRL